MPIIIAIDGPAASGKSTLAALLADEIGFAAVNSGLFYRAMTWAVLEAGIECANARKVERLIESLTLEMTVRGNHVELALLGNDKPVDLRSGSVNATVAVVSAIPAVRDRVNCELRRLAALGPCIVEGRDIGTTVFPETPFKIFLEAPVNIREQRRLAQGEIDDLASRDAADSTRAMAPLQAAPDAEIICVADKNPAEVLAAVLRILLARGLPLHPRTTPSNQKLLRP